MRGVRGSIQLMFECVWIFAFSLSVSKKTSTLDNDLGQLCRGRRIQMLGHSGLGIFNNFGASSIFAWVLASAAAACPAQPGSLHMISMTFGCCHLKW